VSAAEWVQLETVWHDTGVHTCPICGKLITRRAWQFDDEGGAVLVCEPDCQELYETYWRPAYGYARGLEDTWRPRGRGSEAAG
jgi:hypothetical protein